MQNKKLFLKRNKEESILRFHPWIFSGAISKMDPDLNEGDVVDVYDSNGDYLCSGHYQIGSIAVRILTFEKREIDENFYFQRFSEAYQLRKSLNLITQRNDMYRLIHGEGDFLPGLIIDIYGTTAVVQAHSIGMHLSMEMIGNALEKLVDKNLQSIYYKSENTLPFKAGLKFEDSYIMEKGEKNSWALENGLKFSVDWERGQKTGFFLDQRENRSLLENFAKDRTILNMFCYSGGFSVYGLRGGAKHVHSVDSSARAIALTNKNVELNFPDSDRHSSETIDAFRFFQENHEFPYDLVVLDPPAFAKHRDSIKKALQGYKRLNLKAIQRMPSDSILFTFSCSQVIHREQFRQAVFSAAAIAKRRVKILHQLSQPEDHPINIYHPEGEYLKGLVLHIL